MNLSQYCLTNVDTHARPATRAYNSAMHYPQTIVTCHGEGSTKEYLSMDSSWMDNRTPAPTSPHQAWIGNPYQEQDWPTDCVLGGRQGWRAMPPIGLRAHQHGQMWAGLS